MNFQLLVKQCEQFFNAIPDWVAFWLGNVVIVILGLMFGKGFGNNVARTLVNWGFNELWHAPWKAKGRPGSIDSRRVNQAEILGGLLRWTIYGIAAYAILRRHSFIDAAQAVQTVLKTCWAVAVVLVGGAFIGRSLAAAVVDFIHESANLNREPGERPAFGEEHSFATAMAPLAGTLVWAFVFLMMAMLAVEVLAWDKAFLSLWSLFQLALRLVATAIVLMIGWVGVRWADQNSVSPSDLFKGPVSERPALTEKVESSAEALPKAFRLGLILMTIVAAFITFIGTLSSSVYGWFVLLFLVVAAVALRRQIADIFAALVLTVMQTRKLEVKGVRHVLKQRGLIASEWVADGQVVRIRNATMLDALVTQPPEAGPESQPGPPDFETPHVPESVQASTQGQPAGNGHDQAES